VGSGWLALDDRPDNVGDGVNENQEVWDDFFCTLVGWTMHPGYYRENATKPTIEECADMADEMMRVRNSRTTE